jgi:hypothetical protein
LVLDKFLIARRAKIHYTEREGSGRFTVKEETGKWGKT